MDVGKKGGNVQFQQSTMFGVDPKAVEPAIRGKIMSRVWKVCRDHPEATDDYHLLLFYIWEEDGILGAAAQGPHALKDFFQQRATNHATIGRAFRKCKEEGYIRETKATRLRRRRAESEERQRWGK